MSVTASPNTTGASWAKVYHQSAHKASFCDECGTLLQLPAVGRIMKCDLCGKSVDLNSQTGRVITTKSKPKKKLLEIDSDAQAATVNELCAACGHEEMFFRTAQLRSADEGQTVFYECCKCGHRETINT